MRRSAAKRVDLSGGSARLRIRPRPAGRASHPATPGPGRLAALGPLLAALGVAACSSSTAPPPPPPPPASGSLATEVVADGLDRPLYLTAPAGDARRFIVEQTGRIRILGADGALGATPFLDLSGRISSGGERGLLGLAFHPGYASNGRFYVDYTDPGGDTVVERYTVSADPDVADPASAKRILGIPQPFANHNGGQLAFGPDGMLYVFTGDGGGAGDHMSTGQDPTDLLGAILRLDVDGGDPYAIPPDNPYVGIAAARSELWAIGLRNPWRSWFDVAGGTLYVADVGQAEREEVNAVAIDEAGVNYGWNRLEGTRCYVAQGCDASGTEPPVAEYTHADGCSITGGAVYRGSAIPEIAGHYFYSDYCSGFLRSFRLSGGQAVEPEEWSVGALGSVTSFGVDAAGELYVMNAGGTVYRLVPGG